jgi:hypothetical protein
MWKKVHPGRAGKLGKTEYSEDEAFALTSSDSGSVTQDRGVYVVTAQIDPGTQERPGIPLAPEARQMYTIA